MKRPKIKIPKTRSEWVFDCIGYSIFIGTLIFLASIWTQLPEEVPAHYNALGEVDRWGSKWELLILPLSGAFTLLLMQAFEKFPEVHNYPKRLNESNAKEFYLNSRKMLNQLKNMCLMMFSFILIESITIALGWSHGIGGFFLPIVIIVVVIPIVLMLVRQRKIK